MGDLIALPAHPRPRTSAQGRGRHALLWREAVGHELRRERHAQERTQGDVAEEAGISTQYLSEVERGRKEASSEILEAVTGALHLPLPDLVLRAAGLLRPVSDLTSTSITEAPSRPTGPVLLAA